GKPAKVLFAVGIDGIISGSMYFLAVRDLRTGNHPLSRSRRFMDGELLATNGTARDYELCGPLTQAQVKSFVALLPSTRFSLALRFSRLASSRLDARSRIASMRARLTPKKASCGRFYRIVWQKFRVPGGFPTIPRNS